VDASARAAGRIRVVIGGARSGVRPAASIPPKPVALPPRTAAQRQDAGVAAAAARLELLRPLLVSIDTRADVPEGSLRDALREFAAIKQTLASLRTSEAQDALMKVCVLGTAAAEARIEAQQHGDATRRWTAASAAAGALVTLDRAPTARR